VWIRDRESSEATDLPRSRSTPQEFAEKEARKMGDKKSRKEEIVVETETHRVRSMMILLIVAAVTFGLWYLVSDRG
jgi:hypothetical protein